MRSLPPGSVSLSALRLVSGEVPLAVQLIQARRVGSSPRWCNAGVVDGRCLVVAHPTPLM